MKRPLLIGSILLILAALFARPSLDRKSTPTNTTVSITNFAKTSGGTGTIVYHSKTESRVLTNGHVCGVVDSGGLVNDDEGNSHFVTAYRKSQKHDLCLITVTDDLKYSTRVADSPPEAYDEEQTVGHPHLLPTIITRGNFSGKVIIQVMTGARDCTPTELADPTLGFICQLVGQLPVVKSYESIVVSSLIQPGSSGSGIRDSNNEITAVVFAGSGNLGFGFAVPHEYVYNFLHYEVNGLEAVNVSDKPLPIVSESSRAPIQKKLKRLCSHVDSLSSKEKAICKSFNLSSKIQDMIQR